MLKHTEIWRAIDRLAEHNKLSASGLARKAGLDPTTFNVSKRSMSGRPRWPSTESIMRILRATQTPLDDFLALANDDRFRKGDHIVLKTQTGNILVGKVGKMNRQQIELFPAEGKGRATKFARAKLQWAHKVIWTGR